MFDNGGEYEDTKSKKFCYEHGFKMERTMPGTPQYNGIADELNIDRKSQKHSYTVRSTKTIMGRSSQYNNLLDQSRTINPIRIQITRGGIEQQRDHIVALKGIWLCSLCAY